MINNQWYAIASSDLLKPGKLTGLRRFGKNLVLYRNQAGKLGCVTDLCAHRDSIIGSQRFVQSTRSLHGSEAAPTRS